jgi:hypothetical protein
LLLGAEARSPALSSPCLIRLPGFVFWGFFFGVLNRVSRLAPPGLSPLVFCPKEGMAGRSTKMQKQKIVKNLLTMNDITLHAFQKICNETG